MKALHIPSRAIRYFFRDATLSIRGEPAKFTAALAFTIETEEALDFDWMGRTYRFERQHRPLTASERRMVAAIAAVISARYRSISSRHSAAGLHLFEGLPEDRYVSTFVNPAECNRDMLAGAIAVLRQSSLITYENQRISTGVIVVNQPLEADAAARALRYCPHVGQAIPPLLRRTAH